MTWTPSRKAVEAAMKECYGFPYTVCKPLDWQVMRRALRAAYQTDHPKPRSCVRCKHLEIAHDNYSGCDVRTQATKLSEVWIDCPCKVFQPRKARP